MAKKEINYPFIHTLRYMGNKTKLLNFIIPIIESLTNEGDTICDIMAGTSSVGFALSQRNRIISNDFLVSSSVVAKALLKSTTIPCLEQIHMDIDNNYSTNFEDKNYSFFHDEYADTYFSQKQCLQIDSIRYAISRVEDKKVDLYLTFLMSAMCKAQSAPGHFAQFLNKDSKRVQPLRQLDILELFYEKAKEFQDILVPNYENRVFNKEYNDLFRDEDLSEVKCFYLDPPYTGEQYSRFYHLLDTVCLYDYPQTSCKAKYRNDRKKSKFCYKSSVYEEFEKIIAFAKNNNSSLVISYSNRGIADPQTILEIGERYYNNCRVLYEDYNHSTQGSGSIKIQECLIILSIE